MLYIISAIITFLIIKKAVKWLNDDPRINETTEQENEEAAIWG